MSPGLTESLAETASDTPDPDGAGAGEPDHASVSPRAVELRARVRGVGLWTQAHASLEAWIADGMPERWAVPDEPARPLADLLHSRLRRRTSTLTRAAVTAIQAATATSGGALDAARFVLVSSFGEIETTTAILAQLADPRGPISPTKFHNSVHNTATGYLSIAAGNHCEATALAGGPHSLEIGLLEVLAGFADGGQDALLVFAEEQLPAPFDRADAEQTFAVALHLAPFDGPGLDAPGEGALDVELRLASGPRRAPAALAPGVGGIGLPTMVAPLFELVRDLVAIANGEEPGRTHVLGAGHDPAVASTWTTSLRPLSSSRGGSND